MAILLPKGKNKRVAGSKRKRKLSRASASGKERPWLSLFDESAREAGEASDDDVFETDSGRAESVMSGSFIDERNEDDITVHGRYR